MRQTNDAIKIIDKMTRTNLEFEAMVAETSNKRHMRDCRGTRKGAVPPNDSRFAARQSPIPRLSIKTFKCRAVGGDLDVFIAVG